MSIRAPTRSERRNIYWTPTMERYIIDLLLDQILRGNRKGHTFAKQAWVDMLDMFNANFGSEFDMDVLKNQYTNMWKQFNDIKNLLDRSGFSWDDTRKMVIADECAWDKYVEAHPDAKSYRNKTLRNYNELCLIYAYTTADGRYTLSSHDVDFEDDIQGFNFGDAVVSVPTVSKEQPKPDWTPAMNQYLIKLMLDQVRKGNRRNNTFSKQAWTDIITLFNANFCSQLGKRVLIHQYRKLWKYFSDINCILKHKEFFWDDGQQMILASDDVWDDYVEAHPRAELFRRKTLLNYNDLDVIFGNEMTKGIFNRRGQYKDLKNDIVQIINENGQPPVVNGSSKTLWTVRMDRYLIDLLLEQALEGNKIEHAFISEAWMEIVRKFNIRFGSHCGTDVLKDRYNHLRRQYNNIKILLEQSGFSYDDTREMVSAEDYIWDSYTNVHPDAQSYRHKTVPSYHKLCVIFGQEMSNGRSDHVPHYVDLDNEGPGSSNGESAMECHAYGDNLSWSPSMDRYLIDIMLEQILKGNGIDRTFNKQSWINMVTLFTERFKIQCDRYVLRGRHKILMKLYNDMKRVLNQNRFFWDEAQQMVTTYDDIWGAYSKDQPALNSFTTKSTPNFNDLCILYGKSTCGSSSDKSEMYLHLNKPGRGSREVTQSNIFKKEWTPPMDRYFIDIMLEHVRKGMLDNKFNKQAWGDMVAKFNATFGSQHGSNVLKIRFKKLKKLFDDMKLLLNHHGFVWDETRQMITADDDMWNSYIKDHPDAESYRCRSFPNYNDLHLIYGNATNNGIRYSPRHSVDVGDSIVGLNSGEEDDPSSANSDPLRQDWTKPMDRYLIDLMLEQILKGNKVGLTLSERIWVCIMTSFNKKFGPYEKYILENRYLRLMKEYHDIRNLLSQRGFLWDEMRQQVIADDAVWEALMKEQPDMIKYRHKALENYNNLSVISGSGILDERLSRMGINAGNMDYNMFDREMDEIYGILQSPPLEIELLYQKATKRLSSTFSSLTTSSRKVKKTSNKVKNKLPCMTSISEESNNSISIETIVAALETIPELDEELFFDACELLEDKNKVKTFITMDVNMRKKWLLRKLQS